GRVTGPIHRERPQRARATIAENPLPGEKCEFPKGGPLAALHSPRYRLALVKPGWSVAEGQNLAGRAPAALTRVTLDLSLGDLSLRDLSLRDLSDGAPMQSTLKPKQPDDPHDVLEVAPGVVLVAPA